MGQQEVSNIIQALVASQNRKQQAAQFAAQLTQKSEAAKALKDQQDRQFKLTSDKLKDEHDLHQQTLDVTKQMRKLQLQEALQREQDNIYKNGTLPAGGAFMGQGSLQSGGQVQLPSAFNDPDTGESSTLNVEGLQQHAQHQADLQRILMAPQDEIRLKEKAAAAYDAEDKQKKQNDFQLQLHKMTQDAEDHRAALTRSSMERVAKIRAAPGGDTLSDEGATQLQQHANNLLDGTETVEQLKKLYPGKQAPIFTQIVNLASQHGVPLHDKDVEQLTALQQHASNIPLVDAAIAEKPTSNNHITSVLQSPLLWNNSKFNSAVDQLKSHLPKTSVSLSGVKRFNNNEINMVGGGYIPTASSPKNQDMMNRDLTIQALHKAAEDIIPNATPGQKALIKKRIGLDQLKLYDNSHQPGSVPTGVNQNAVDMDKINALLPPPPQAQ